MAPEYTAAASSLDPLIPFYAVDCDAAKNKALCAEMGIQGYPSIKSFPKGGKGAARDYNGERKRGAFVEYAKTMVTERVTKLRADGNADDVLTTFFGKVGNTSHMRRPDVCLTIPEGLASPRPPGPPIAALDPVSVEGPWTPPVRKGMYLACLS